MSLSGLTIFSSSFPAHSNLIADAGLGINRQRYTNGELQELDATPPNKHRRISSAAQDSTPDLLITRRKTPVKRPKTGLKLHTVGSEGRPAYATTPRRIPRMSQLGSPCEISTPPAAISTPPNTGPPRRQDGASTGAEHPRLMLDLSPTAHSPPICSPGPLHNPEYRTNHNTDADPASSVSTISGHSHAGSSKRYSPSTEQALSRSAKRARPAPGSPVWKHMKMLQAQRKAAHHRVESIGSGHSGHSNQISPSPASNRQHSPLGREPYLATEQMEPLDNPAPVLEGAPRTRDNSKSLQIIQLELFAERSSSYKDLLDGHDLDMDDMFSLVYLASLMHSVYRPQHPDREVLVLAPYEPNSIVELQSKWGNKAPTHVHGLAAVNNFETNILVWGNIDFVGPHAIEVHLTAYDNPPGTAGSDTLQGVLAEATGLMMFILGPKYELRKTTRYPAVWPDRARQWTEHEASSYFAQLISTVVHDQPPVQDLGRSWTASPVQPMWPADLVSEKVELVLNQLRQRELTLQGMVQRGSHVPVCIYLHGNHMPWGDTDEEQCFRDDRFDMSNQDPTPDRLSEEPGRDPSLAHIALVGKQNKYFVQSKGSVVFRANTPSSCLSSSTSEIGAGTLDEEIQRNLIAETFQQVYADRNHAPVARMAFWEQLRNCTPGMEATALLTTHLWLSCMTANPKSNYLYIDPILAADMIRQSTEDDDILPDLNGYTTLWDRHKLWPAMASDAHILVLAQLAGATCRGEATWVMIDLHAQCGIAKGVDILLPPTDGTNGTNDLLDLLVGRLIGQLNFLLPRPSLLRKTTPVQQRLNTLVIPTSWTGEMIWLVMIAHLCGRFLAQDIQAVDVEPFRQNICYYYNHALRGPKVNISLPWEGLMAPDGTLLAATSVPKVSRHRLSLASNRELAPFDAFPRRRSYSVPLVSPGPSAPFFAELALPATRFPEDMLVGTSGRSVEHLEKVLFLGDYPSWPESLKDEKMRRPDALSLDEYYDLVHSIGGPESLAGQRLLLTGEHEGEHVRLDWLKDTPDLELDWLMASTDVDSLSLTTYDAPTFLQPGSYYPYPSRAMTITNRNDLKVNIGGTVLELHTCPNFCMMNFGANNQFRLMIFFPNCREKTSDTMWRTFTRKGEMSDWYHIFLTALRMIATEVSEEWRHAVAKTIEALPINYQAAALKCSPKGAPRSFLGYRIEPHVVNLGLAKAREIVDSTPEYAKYRQYLFHLCGINLKLGTQNIHGREDENPLNYAFRVNSFIDWYAQNPNNIAVDVGLAINLDRRRVPEDLKRSTLLLRYEALRELLLPGYKKPKQDRYCHSHVISGLRSCPLKSVGEKCGTSKFLAYLKVMVLHYIHQGKSIGANFTVEEALGLGHRDTFSAEMSGFRELLQYADAYGLRFEWRLSPWAANRLMLYNPRDIMERFFNAGVIVCHPTATLSSHLTLCSRGWSGVLDRQRELSKPLRKSPEVKILASVLAYWLKGLVKRPDDMSASVELAEQLDLVCNAQSYGLPSLRSGVLQQSGLELNYVVGVDSFKILRHTAAIRPGGQKIKSSRAQPEPVGRLQTPPTTPSDPNRVPPVSEDFLQEILQVRLPRAIWSLFPDAHKVIGVMARRLRRGPLRQKDWAKVVEPLNEWVFVTNNFGSSLDRLLPQGWTSGVRTGDFGAYDRDFLSLIRGHIGTIPEVHRPAYSEALRNKIRQVIMNDWDYLPAMQANKMWTFRPLDGAVRRYRLARAPI
ncbi:alpha-1,3-glucan synthase ags1 [Ceratobasidium sp. AG-Ba]|nr:alpha-1,3-glucan synthase ags1 [Ceratobasidium sp. AG-Ba]